MDYYCLSIFGMCIGPFHGGVNGIVFPILVCLMVYLVCVMVHSRRSNSLDYCFVIFGMCNRSFMEKLVGEIRLNMHV